MKHLVITGPDGSGKSTVAKTLIAALQPKRAVIASPWDCLAKIRQIFSLEHIPPQSFVQNYLGHLPQPARLYFLYHAVHASFHEKVALNPDFLISDGYWYKYALSEICFGLNSEQAFASSALFPEPDLVVCLMIEPELALERKKILSDYERGGEDDPSRFLALQKSAFPLWSSLGETRRWSILEADREIGVLTAAILDLLGQSR